LALLNRGDICYRDHRFHAPFEAHHMLHGLCFLESATWTRKNNGLFTRSAWSSNSGR
jgi:hypothetical protein